ncbi:thiamine phosphate synthase [Pedobacter duraquae]|uniref:Thiamine-phosphate synthase n=1 Tax=Pedobacter duraquae TaxID=425511 RepID=A0A4R6IQI6_9SPHI|nr:thiamine phosphate synthase [Pedobacter duraquae]TDO24461.1 thiamine-phosphate diphosphorylase [Pedobacter duraquae]
MNLDKQISRLHYISQESADKTHIAAILTALRAGCKWIQLRVKNRAEEEVLKLAFEVRDLCKEYSAQLIINDYPEVALQVNAHGLHLGLLDMPVAQARLIVGTKLVIGGTANTFDHVCRRVAEGVDYIGLGPFRFTRTKENLSPILGISGFRTIMKQVQMAGIATPIIAIGGITAADVPELLDAGVFGVAMSGAITQFTEPMDEVDRLHKQLDQISFTNS